MNIQRCMFAAYRLLLQLYPPAFRQRFAAEMLQIAREAESSEWPLIFGDTGVAIIRCWMEGTHSTVALAEPNPYVPIGEFHISAARLLPGLVLAIGLLAGLCYANNVWPTPCSGHVKIHASRNAVTGSTFAARRAGI
jgi:hypothetical protein